ncbi:hypothetical protein AVEN_163655-1 [Araneus ventricosus]|uniref:Uncharacterized protein n=1 Tax=Araneus ventricosus TaxID=182803 RepID=A0A4Y2E7X6_ARAVE|nr:hypothetical protein AVEN_163655-1 [Araneus ventricosus]
MAIGRMRSFPTSSMCGMPWEDFEVMWATSQYMQVALPSPVTSEHQAAENSRRDGRRYEGVLTALVSFCKTKRRDETIV